MGIYNPHAPYIIGQEWAPIRNAHYTPDTQVERGYSFRLDHSTAIVSGAYYVAEPPPAPVFFQAADLISIYPEGEEDATGPIKSVIIPVKSISTTGSAIDIEPAGSLPTNPGSLARVQFNAGTNRAAFSFDVNTYAQALYGKRILDVRLRYIARGVPESLATGTIALARASAATLGMTYVSGLVGTTAVSGDQIQSVSMTDVNPMWQPGVTNIQTFPQLRIYPWRYPELALFDTTASAADRLVIVFTVSQSSTGVVTAVNLNYVALEVVYCEENRLLYGGDLINSNVLGLGSDFVWPYPNAGEGRLIQLRDPNFNLGATLSPGRYTVTHTTRVFPLLAVPKPKLHAVREYYQLPTQVGRQVNYSMRPNTTFTVDETSVLTQLTLHTSSAVVTGSHAYGTSYGAPVYGSITATQEIEDTPVGSSKTYPQVRFYARRFGDTTVPLTLTDVATGTHTASITVADFDELPEIVDGWREVTLRFANPPSFATAAGDVDWRWSATGETAANQWQILAADGPSFTGAHATGPATYYAADGSGSSVALTWQSPTISGTGEDPRTDATLIFSQDPHPVSGFALEIASQEVTGIGLDCGVPSDCVVTGISYVNLTWSAQSFLPVTGFGGYTLQRYDTITGDWQTIMDATSPTVTGFRDFEARVGVESQYRIRTYNALDFYGPWVTGAATIPAPGVEGTATSSLLIFTTNEDPDASLAYTMQWESQPVENFLFPEADEVILQRAFGRDYFIGFHPLERGGEQFTRTLLVNAASVTPTTLANFTGLRDLAWADVNYVCVRDELGNRWFANVLVSEGTVRSDRTVYLAPVRVAQVTDTPTPIDPSEA